MAAAMPAIPAALTSKLVSATGGMHIGLKNTRRIQYTVHDIRFLRWHIAPNIGAAMHCRH